MGWFATLIFFRGDITSVTGRLVRSLLGFLLTWHWMYLTAPAVLAVVKCVECLIDLGRNWAGAGERMGKQQIRWRVEITCTIPWSGLVTSSACWMNTLFKQLLARGSSVLKENIFAQIAATPWRSWAGVNTAGAVFSTFPQMVCGQQGRLQRAGWNPQRGLGVTRKMSTCWRGGTQDPQSI